MRDLSRYYRRGLGRLRRTRVAEPAEAAAATRTVAEGWERYARTTARKGGVVGDEWNDPAQLGLEMDSTETVVGFLDRTVFEPFFGHCDVMLEIGSGGGRFTEILLPKCRKVIAVDTSPTMLDMLRSRFGDDSRLECLLVDGTGLGPIADDSVDAAFSYGVFVHLQHWDIYNYLVELRRVLRPGGKALIQHGNLLSDLGWAKFTREVQPQLNTHKLPWTFTPNTPELMQELISRAGLECIEMNTEVVKRDCLAFISKPARLRRLSSDSRGD